MTRTDVDLGQRLAVLRAEFAALGSRAAAAARALTAAVPPGPALLDDLAGAHIAFTSLRADVLERAGALSVAFDADRLGGLRDLEPALAAIATAEAHRTRLAAWEEARRNALGVLDDILGLIPREDRSLPALEEIQSRARALHAELSGPPPTALEDETSLLPAKTRPYAEVLALVDGWNVLDDDRCAALQDAITESFGRALSLAALRGKLGRAGEAAPAAPRPRVRPPMASAAAGPAPQVAEAPPPVADPPVEARGEAPTPTAARAAPPAPPEPLAPPRVAAAPAEAVVPGREVLDLETAETVKVDGAGSSAFAPGPAPAAAEHEAELEHLARETATWWVAARGAWQGLTERGVGFGDAAREYLQRYPYLLSVPLSKSSEYEGGQLAEGYALLLAHIEKQEAGFVGRALARLSPQFAAHDPSTPYPIGQELYLYIVAEGRLYKTYPDFVREVVLHTIPQIRAWVQGGIVEGDDETRLFMRAETVGSAEEQTRTLTERKERLGPHVFRVTLGPLTTRFFTLRLAGETLADPPNVEMRLTENDAPTDHGWLVTLPASAQGQPAAPRKHRPGGTTLEELGPQFGGFWLAVFNADPRNDRVYELSIILRRKPPPITDSKPASEQHFFKKK
jgi:hypothetical protein